MIKLIIIPTIFTSFMLEGQRKDVRWKDDGEKKEIEGEKVGSNTQREIQEIFFHIFHICNNILNLSNNQGNLQQMQIENCFTLHKNCKF